jgi:putative endonuclease
MKRCIVYIVSNFKRTTFFTGIANDFRWSEGTHQTRLPLGLPPKDHPKNIVYYEDAISMRDAIAREKQIRNWHRDWKISLIKTRNPQMKDLSNEIHPQEVLTDVKMLNQPQT